MSPPACALLPSRYFRNPARALGWTDEQHRAPARRPGRQSYIIFYEHINSAAITLRLSNKVG